MGRQLKPGGYGPVRGAHPNLAKAVEKCVAAHRGCLAEPAPEAAGDPPPPAEQAGETEPEPSGKFAERARRNHALVHGLRAEGRGIREIARHLGWDSTPSSATTAPPAQC
jgi:hypothetical protein